jgi:uncharacterized protein (DUF1800 family)
VSEIDAPARALLAPLARAFRESGYDVRVPVRQILRSRLFHDESVRRQRVKSPVELAVGLVRSLEILKPTVSSDALADACAQMGQGLYAPLSVAGWEGGPSWVNTTTTLARTNLVLGLLSETDAALGKRLDPRALAERHGSTSAQDVARFYIDLAVQDAFDSRLRDQVVAAASGNDPRSAARDTATLVLTAPEYQLA